jgi:hypothetical protein
VAEPPSDGGWDPQADWEAQVKAARDAQGQAGWDAQGQAGGEAQPQTAGDAQGQAGGEAQPQTAEDAQGQAGGESPAQAAGDAHAQAAGDAQWGPATPAEAAQGTPVPAAMLAEPDVPAQTVPLVPFTPFVAPLAPAVPAAGRDASQAGVVVATATISTVRGMTGILGQDHLRADVMPVRFLSPRLPRGRWHRWWLWRAAFPIAVGGLIGALTGWPAGLIAAGLVLCAGALFTYRVSPAFSPAARASSARRRTRRRLARLGSAGYLSLHGRAIPGTDQVIDHLVVGPAGIYVVDSEVWDRRLPVRATRGGNLFHGPRDQAARLEHARWEAEAAARLIGAALGQPITARPALVIYGPIVPWIVVRIQGVDVFCGRRLRKYLRREAYSRNGYLDEGQIEAICEIAGQVLPPAV